MADRTSIPVCASAIRALAEKGEYGEAVRRFELLVEESAPRSRDAVAADIARAGALQALAKSFARAHCHFCRHGLMSCDLCGGKVTFAANGQFCDACGGYGRVFCAFCGGSGFIPVESVPGDLAVAVAILRLKYAATLLRDVVQRADRMRKESSRSLGDMIRLFQTAVRTDAVLNGVEPLVTSDANKPGPRGPKEGDVRLAAECRRLSRRYRTALAGLIAASCRARAHRLPDESADRITWERQAEYYEAQGAGGRGTE